MRCPWLSLPSSFFFFFRNVLQAISEQINFLKQGYERIVFFFITTLSVSTEWALQKWIDSLGKLWVLTWSYASHGVPSDRFSELPTETQKPPSGDTKPQRLSWDTAVILPQGLLCNILKFYMMWLVSVHRGLRQALFVPHIKLVMWIWGSNKFKTTKWNLAATCMIGKISSLALIELSFELVHQTNDVAI